MQSITNDLSKMDEEQKQKVGQKVEYFQDEEGFGNKWRMASAKVTSDVLAKAKQINWVMGPMKYLKYTHVSGDIEEGECTYKHCKGRYGQVKFRVAVRKIILLEVKNELRPNLWELGVKVPSYGPEARMKINPHMSWKGLQLKLKKKFGVHEGYDSIFLSNGAFLKFRGNCKVRNVLDVSSSNESSKQVKKKTNQK